MSRTTLEDIAKDLDLVGDEDGARIVRRGAAEIERLRAALDQFSGLPPGEYVHTGDMTSSIVITKEALGDE